MPITILSKQKMLGQTVLLDGKKLWSQLEQKDAFAKSSDAYWHRNQLLHELDPDTIQGVMQHRNHRDYLIIQVFGTSHFLRQFENY